MPTACRSAVFCSGSATPRPSSYLPRPYNVLFHCCNFPPLRLNIRRSAAIRAAAKSDHYSTLYADRNATLQETKPSYRNLARKVLSDSENRSLYDQFGDAGLQEEYGSSGTGPGMVDPFEMFDAIFGESNGI